MNDYRDFGQTEPGLQTNFILLLISYRLQVILWFLLDS